MRPFSRRAIVSLTTLLLLLTGAALPVCAQAGFEVQDVNVLYDFGKQITFQARIISPTGVSQASVLFRGSGEDVTRIGSLVLDQNGSVRFSYDASLNVLPPFSTVLFWFQAVLSDGSTQTSPIFNFRYDDNRFP